MERKCIAWPLALVLVVCVAASFKFFQFRHPTSTKSFSMGGLELVEILGATDQHQCEAVQLGFFRNQQPFGKWRRWWIVDVWVRSRHYGIGQPIRQWIAMGDYRRVVAGISRQENNAGQVIAPLSLRTSAFHRRENFKSICTRSSHEEGTKNRPRFSIDSGRFAYVCLWCADEHLATTSYWTEYRDFAERQQWSRRFVSQFYLSTGRPPKTVCQNGVDDDDEDAQRLKDESGAMQTAAEIFGEYAEPTIHVFAVIAVFCGAFVLTAFGLSVLQFRPPRDWSNRLRNATLLFGVICLVVGQVCLWCFLNLVG
jgi:hypothetical protein